MNRLQIFESYQLLRKGQWPINGDVYLEDGKIHKQVSKEESKIYKKQMMDKSSYLVKVFEVKDLNEEMDLVIMEFLDNERYRTHARYLIVEISNEIENFINLYDTVLRPDMASILTGTYDSYLEMGYFEMSRKKWKESVDKAWDIIRESKYSNIYYDFKNIVKESKRNIRFDEEYILDLNDDGLGYNEKGRLQAFDWAVI